ncbi:MAG: formyltransferase family protein [candidate division KSB1 bacterium]|nr:formyltransferase family protein [candidate division KSB1 bacterium]
MIYLFCNTGYGLPFLHEFIKFSKRNHERTTVVFSAKRSKKNKNKIPWRILRSINDQRFILISKITAFKMSIKYGLKFLSIANINSKSFCSKIKNNDHGIIAGFNQIFKKNTIDRFKSLVNFHPSLLPFYRGPVPSYWCLKNGEKYTGYTLHKVAEEIDKGEILFQDVIEISKISSADILDTEIAKSAIPTFKNYLDFLVGKTKFNKKILDASQIYHHRVNYKSFPEAI